MPPQPGSKPNSPFGIFHGLRSVQANMVTECDRQYPGFKRDVERLERDPGVVAYLLNTLIDLEALGYGVYKVTALEPRRTEDPLSDEVKVESA